MDPDASVELGLTSLTESVRLALRTQVSMEENVPVILGTSRTHYQCALDAMPRVFSAQVQTRINAQPAQMSL